MPTYKTPKSFSGMDKLPPLAKTLLERVFPPDELPTPGMVRVPKGAGLKVIDQVRTLPTLSGLTPDVVSGLTRAQQKYPRLFAHIKNVNSETVYPSSNAEFQPMWGRVGSLHFRPGLTGDDALRAIGHELTHSAQNLRSSAQPQMYKLLEDIFGYKNNPMEVSARKSGDKFLNWIRNPKVR